MTMTDEGWRCIFCKQPLGDDEECRKPECQKKLVAMYRRMREDEKQNVG
jgi:hypothetical protein